MPASADEFADLEARLLAKQQLQFDALQKRLLGSVAAPTAGLHFPRDKLDALARRQALWCESEGVLPDVYAAHMQHRAGHRQWSGKLAWAWVAAQPGLVVVPLLRRQLSVLRTELLVLQLCHPCEPGGQLVGRLGMKGMQAWGGG